LLYIVHNFVLYFGSFIIFYFSYHVVIAYIVFMHEHLLLYTHTHQVAFWRPWIHTSRYWKLCFYCSGVRWDRTLREKLELLPIWFRYSYPSYLSVISWFSIYQIQLLFKFFIYMISCVDAYLWYCS